MPEELPPPDPSLIDEAPIEPDSLGGLTDSDKEYLELIGALSAELESTKAELANATGQQTFDQVRAALLAPYSNKVFLFVIGYSVFVGLIIVGDGFGGATFEVSDTILGIIAGSTGVTVVGLIGIVISGLFGVRKPN